MGMFEPAEGINYNFILGMYLFFLSLGSLFLALEFAFKVEAVQGFYLIFAREDGQGQQLLRAISLDERYAEFWLARDVSKGS